VCPPFLKLTWENELENWLCDFHQIQVLNKSSDIPNPQADVLVVPDSLIIDHDFRERIVRLGVQFTYLFVDEAHRFKTPTARRSLSLLGSRQVKLGKGRTKKLVTWKGFHRIADHVCALSGTPMPNRPLELYPLISRHAPHALSYLDPHRYGVRYCNGFEAEYGWDYQGASNLDELNAILCRNYMLVRKLQDCVDMPEKLPPSYIYLEDTRGELKKDEMRLLKSMKLSEIIDLVSRHNEDFRQRVQDKLEDNPEMGAFGFISELRKMLGLAKVKKSVDVIKQLLQDNHKIIVFCWHKEVAHELYVALSDFNPLKITGDNANRRHGIVQDFQTKNAHRVLVANIQAAGVGYTMTASSTVVFVEPSWVPAENDQAVSRAYRLTQTKAVQTFFLVVKDSLDHLVLNAHITKNEIINAAIKPHKPRG
jgi:SWI/SNF-related matrix-associated actin-dependent regulator of chromatin subfamily A-like protein 1